MSLNRYYNSRASDNVFKLIHEESSYLDILKGNVKALHKDEIKETGTEKADDKQLLHEKDDLPEGAREGGAGSADTEADIKADQAADSGSGKEGTPDQQDKAVEKASEKAAEVDKEMGVKEFVEMQLDEISIAIARQGASRVAKKKALATRGFLRSKEPLQKIATPKKVVPGLRG